MAGDLTEVHREILDALAVPCGGVWHTFDGPGKRTFFRELVYHLWGAGRGEEARALVRQLPWLERKLQVSGINALLDDFRGEDSSGPVARALRQAAHILEQHPEDLGTQLLLRVGRTGEAADLVTQCGARPGWRPGWASLEGDPALLRLLEGHSGLVTSVAVEGNVVVSGSLDKTIRVWDRESGKALRVLEGHSEFVTSVAVTGNVVVSGSIDETIRIWDRESGKMLRVLEGHSDWVNSVAVTGNLVVSGSDDKTIRIWNRYSGACILILRVDAKVNSVAADGDWIACGDQSGRVHVLRRTRTDS